MHEIQHERYLGSRKKQWKIIRLVFSLFICQQKLSGHHKKWKQSLFYLKLVKQRINDSIINSQNVLQLAWFDGLIAVSARSDYTVLCKEYQSGDLEKRVVSSGSIWKMLHTGACFNLAWTNPWTNFQTNVALLNKCQFFLI